MAVNISGPFMKRHHIDQLHSQNATWIQLQLVPLAAVSRSEKAQMEPPFANAYISQDYTVPACHQCRIQVKLPQV